MTRPADQLDIASELEESERAHGAGMVRAALQAQGADECHDCGDTIPPERRKAKHLPVIAAMATTSTMKEIASATKTTVVFVSRVIKEEGLRG